VVPEYLIDEVVEDDIGTIQLLHFYYFRLVKGHQVMQCVLVALEPQAFSNFLHQVFVVEGGDLFQI
jgi:hypothetical protein